MHAGLETGVFPGAVVLGATGETLQFHRAYGWANLFTRQPMDLDTVFDLASLTKPLATTLAILFLVGEHRIGLDQSVDDILPGFAETGKGAVSVRHLLTHRSGYPAHRPYFENAKHLNPAAAIMAIRKWLVAEPLIDPPGNKTVYSDLGFIVLAWVIEAVTGVCFRAWVTERVYSRLGIDTLFFPLEEHRHGRWDFAATEWCPWRNRVLEGRVHDDNAYVMGGASGHAGLFGTAHGIWRLLRVLMQDARESGENRLLSQSLAQGLFQVAPGAERPFGMDVPTPGQSSCGRLFSTHAVGHLGFTGTSFWMEPDTERVVILLTNRVHPFRNNWKIRSFRPGFHDAMMAMLSPGYDESMAPGGTGPSI